MDVSILIKEIKTYRELSAEEYVLLQRAYSFSKDAHSAQKRKSGEPYFSHVFQTALIIAKWRLDLPTIIAGLFHDTVEDTEKTITDIKKEFGDEVAFLVDGVTKISHIKYRGNTDQVETLKKMILAIGEDIRVVFVKLADRLHNMKTLSAIPVQKQRRIALETWEIYAPLAMRLGMSNISGELEDLAFPFLYPDEYVWLKNHVQEQYASRQAYLTRIESILKQELEKNTIPFVRIDTRAKRLASLYKKLLRYDMNVEGIHDLVAMRIIVPTVADCYAVLGIIHQLWPPLPGRIKDYIALPKPNGYKSLHTTVFCLENKPTEFQIRTQEIHEEAENGIAAYWAYHQGKGTKQYQKGQTIFAKQRDMEWIAQLKNWQKECANSEEFVNSMRIDFFKDRIFVITPTGEAIDLPLGATPVDFAYAIHSDVGDHCVGARVNGRMVALDHLLQSGDVIEITTQKNKKPSTSWMEFIKSSKAKKKIKVALKRLGLRDDHIPKMTEFKITYHDRVGILNDITAAIARMKINIVNVQFSPKNKNLMLIVCEVNEKEKTEKLVLKIKDVKGVKDISWTLGKN
ncbi:MAG: (P)ppGpp synthetase I, SpoT/RelA [Parcubacteria group bacterium GW2011_GWC1_41_7]|nr:MAG: (P)ppGpp synthetase I, SpoT/RelA [Parcubacteria group bacterium GW2011_GWC1_41_7]